MMREKEKKKMENRLESKGGGGKINKLISKEILGVMGGRRRRKSKGWKHN